MATLPGVLLRGIRADQPDPADAPAGTLYCVTDEKFKVERSSGAAWEKYSPDPAIEGPGSSVDDNLATWDGTSGGLLQDSGMSIADVIADAVTASVAALPDVVDGPASAVDDRIVTFDGTSGKLIQDGGKTIAGLTADIVALIAPLAVITYAPSTTTKSSSSATFADADSTNLAITFTVPASGKVMVRLIAFGDVSVDGNQYRWSLREGSTDLSVGGTVVRGTSGYMLVLDIFISGLTPNDSKTYKWSHACLQTPAATGRFFAGPGGADFPPATMEVWAA